MAWLVVALGLVATIQGVAWIDRNGGVKRAAGVALAVLGIVSLGLGVVHGLVPAFFGP